MYFEESGDQWTKKAPQVGERSWSMPSACPCSLRLCWQRPTIEGLLTPSLPFCSQLPQTQNWCAFYCWLFSNSILINPTECFGGSQLENCFHMGGWWWKVSLLGEKQTNPKHQKKTQTKTLNPLNNSSSPLLHKALHQEPLYLLTTSPPPRHFLPSENQKWAQNFTFVFSKLFCWTQSWIKSWKYFTIPSNQTHLKGIMPSRCQLCCS